MATMGRKLLVEMDAREYHLFNLVERLAEKNKHLSLDELVLVIEGVMRKPVQAEGQRSGERR